ncbi:unnamed protein product [Effrenium voratum]|nr:unnamed protein product [Effrenium voratum]
MAGSKPRGDEAAAPASLRRASADLARLAKGENWPRALHTLSNLSAAGVVCDAVCWNAAFGSRGASRWRAGVFGLLRSARAQQVRADVVSFNVATARVGETPGGWRKALALNWEMRQAALAPDEVSLNSGVTALRGAAPAESWRWALNLLRCGGNLVTLNAVMGVCEKSALWLQAGAVLELVMQPDLVTFSTVASASLRGQAWRQALAAEKGDVVGFGLALAAAGRRGWEDAQALMQDLGGARIEPSLVCLGALLSALESSCVWRRALGALRRGPEAPPPAASAVCLGAASTACARTAQWREGLRLASGPFADLVTFSSAISACDAGKRWVQALRCLRAAGRHTDLVSHNTALSACGRAWRAALRTLRLGSRLGLGLGGNVVCYASALDAAVASASASECSALFALPQLLRRLASAGVEAVRDRIAFRRGEEKQTARLAGSIERLWRVTSLDDVPRRWTVASVSFYWDLACSTRMEEGNFMASGWALGFEVAHAFLNESLELEWASACDGCGARQAWLALSTLLPSWPRCVRIYQTTRAGSGTAHLAVERFDGSDWALVADKQEATAAAWEDLRLPGPGGIYSYPYPVSTFEGLGSFGFRVAWRLLARPTRWGWRVSSLRFFSDLSCLNETVGIPGASSFLQGQGPNLSATEARREIAGGAAAEDLEADKAEAAEVTGASREPSHIEHSSLDVLAETSWAEKLSLACGAFLALLQGISSPLIAIFTADSITTLTTTEPSLLLDTMTDPLIKIGLLAMAQFLLGWAWNWLLGWAAAKQAFRWQIKYLKSLLSLDVPWYDAHEPAGLAARLEGEIASVYIFQSAALGYLIASIGQFVSGIVVELL